MKMNGVCHENMFVGLLPRGNSETTGTKNSH